MMKIPLVVALLCGLASAALAQDVHVNGYYKDTDGDGFKETHVAPHYRTAPDSSTYNNYSTRNKLYSNNYNSVNDYNPPKIDPRAYRSNYR